MDLFPATNVIGFFLLVGVGFLPSRGTYVSATCLSRITHTVCRHGWPSCPARGERCAPGPHVSRYHLQAPPQSLGTCAARCLVLATSGWEPGSGHCKTVKENKHTYPLSTLYLCKYNRSCNPLYRVTAHLFPTGCYKQLLDNHNALSPVLSHWGLPGALRDRPSPCRKHLSRQQQCVVQCHLP